jgi:dolichol kinase
VLVVPGVTALFAAAVELITPFGLDNLTVPLLTVLFYRGVFVR